MMRQLDLEYSSSSSSSSTTFCTGTCTAFSSNRKKFGSEADPVSQMSSLDNGNAMDETAARVLFRAGTAEGLSASLNAASS